MTCPKAACGQRMEPDPRMNCDASTDLQYFRCRHCGHVGMKAQDGLHLLFSGQHEYVLSYGPSLAHLKVVLSTVALNIFKAQDVTPAELATYVAEWALLMGQTCGTVRLTGNLVLSDCFEYCRRQALKNPGVTRL